MTSVTTLGRELLDDRVHVLLGLVGQLHERPPARAVGGDVLLVEPPSVDVAEEVVLGPDVGVHARAGVVEDAHGGRGYCPAEGALRSAAPRAGPAPPRIWHQQVFAGLTLKADPAKWNGDKAVTVEFKVPTPATP